MIAVDANIIAALYLSSDRSAQAEQVLRRDPEWVAPLLWRSELRSVLALYLRKKLLTLPDALAVMDEAGRLMRDREYEVASVQVLRLVAGSTCSAYDCEFVALAQDLGVPLVTTDRQVLAQFPGLAVPLEEYAA
jgi:predicted nucleic acid-binding protein